MSDFGIYWKNFARESKRGDWPCLRWLTNSDRLIRHVAPGDRLWLFTSGNACGMSESDLGYLIEIFTVASTGNNPGDNPDYPVGEFSHVIHGEPARCIRVDSPLLIDELIRPEGQTADLSIGTIRQGPWKLPEETVAKLQERLGQERPEVFAKTFES